MPGEPGTLRAMIRKMAEEGETPEKIYTDVLEPYLAEAYPEFRQFAEPVLRDEVRRIWRAFTRKLEDEYRGLTAQHLAAGDERTRQVIRRQQAVISAKLARAPVRYFPASINFEELTLDEAERQLARMRSTVQGILTYLIEPLENSIALLSAYPPGTRLKEVPNWQDSVIPGAYGKVVP